MATDKRKSTPAVNSDTTSIDLHGLQSAFTGTSINTKWHAAFAIALSKVLRVRLIQSDMTTADGSFALRAMLSFRTAREVVDSGVFINNRLDISAATADQHEDIRVALATHAVEELLKPISIWIDIAMRGTTYTVEDILRLKNVEQRMAALRIFGADRLIQETQATLLNKSKRGNELYMIPKSRGLFEEDAYFLKYQCVSTGRIYVSGVPPGLFNMQSAVASFTSATIRDRFNMSLQSNPFTRVVRQTPDIEAMYLKRYPTECWADLAMAWKFSLSYEQYCTLQRENEA